ncbi:MAG: DUF2256 domain-containing protein [Gemmatimonadaceae bacterium]|nr:DUF2256 domain-containing protein [Gemmatimonadaceae bacterium]
MTPRESRLPRAHGTNGHADKICARCGRPFSWRKKWERDWEQVRYCSDRCRKGKAADEAGRFGCT